MKTNKITRKLNAYTLKHSCRTKATPIVLIAVIGISTLLISQAATFSVALEPELASNKTGVTTPTGDSTASGNSYVQFGTGSTTTSDFPTAATTGWQRTGVTLTPLQNGQIAGVSVNDSGDVWSVRTAGTVIDGKDITGCVNVLAANVTIKRSRIKCSGFYGIAQEGWGADGTSRGNLIIEDTEITSVSSTQWTDRAISLTSGGATMTRVYIHDTQRGVEFASNNLLQDSYIFVDARHIADAHATALVVHGPVTNNTVRNNTVKALKATAAFAIESDNGRSSGWTVDHNLFAADDAGFCVYWDGSNITAKNNQYSTEYYPNCGMYGPNCCWNGSLPGMVWTNNTWYDGPKKGQTVSP